MWSRVKEVFTAEYQKEIEYRDFLLKSLTHFKLNNKSENVEIKIGRASCRERVFQRV